MIKWQTASAADYEIEVSTDGKIYNKVAEFSGLTGARTDKIILRDSVEAKYIRIVPTKRSTGYPVAIFDFTFMEVIAKRQPKSLLMKLKMQPRKKLIRIALLMMIGKL